MPAAPAAAAAAAGTETELAATAMALAPTWRGVANGVATTAASTVATATAATAAAVPAAAATAETADGVAAAAAAVAATTLAAALTAASETAAAGVVAVGARDGVPSGAPTAALCRSAARPVCVAAEGAGPHHACVSAAVPRAGAVPPAAGSAPPFPPRAAMEGVQVAAAGKAAHPADIPADSVAVPYYLAPTCYLASLYVFGRQNATPGTDLLRS